MQSNGAIQVILASASPRRAELLKQLTDAFTVIPAAVAELQASDESATDYVRRLAFEKAQAVAANVSGPALVIGSDTLIDFNGQVMEKPRDYADFVTMLGRLSDHTHDVRTAVSVIATAGDGRVHQTTIDVVTKVTLGHITAQQLDGYWATGEPTDKAGGYAIQGLAARFVKRIQGSYSAVVGLPLYETNELLEQSRQWLESAR